MTRRFVHIAVLAAAFCQAAALAQDAVKLGNVVISGSMRLRVESWDWFNPGGTVDNAYTFPGAILRLGIGESKPRLDWQMELAAPILLALPDNAIAPGTAGQLGMGASYFAANNRQRNDAMIFVKQGYLRWKFTEGATKQTLRLGRFEFSDGAEAAPQDATLRTLKRDRIAQRLIGPFGFTDVGRSMDGAEYALTRGKGNLTLTAFRPTRGVFQTDGWGDLKINVLYGAWTRQFAGKQPSELRLFAAGYLDERDNVLKTDSRPAAIRRADTGHIRIGSYGAHYLALLPTRTGAFDVLLWGVLQSGWWGTQRHGAYAWAAEAGWQPAVLPRLKPWLRAGINYGSGDRDPNDGRHGSFFQLLPTPRPYARMPFFNMMNLRDAFGEAIFRPAKAVTLRADFHSLRLANASDLWYSGGGAFQPWTFGYTGRASAAPGSRSLANLLDVSADYTVNSHLTLGAYLGHVAAKTVIRSIYPAEAGGNYGYFEAGYRF
jgi:hypothetical protein